MTPAEFKEWAMAIVPAAFALGLICVSLTFVWSMFRRDE